MPKPPSCRSRRSRAADGVRSSVRGVLLILLVAGGSAHAEKADRDKPINVEADKVTLDDINKVSVFEGAVVLTQGTLKVTGDKVIVKQDKEGNRVANAWGKPVTFRQKLDGTDDILDGVADRMDYDSRADKIELFNRATLRRGQDELHGNYISYEAKTDYMQVLGSSSGTNNTSASMPGRVKAVIQPRPKAAGSQ